MTLSNNYISNYYITPPPIFQLFCLPELKKSHTDKRTWLAKNAHAFLTKAKTRATWTHR